MIDRLLASPRYGERWGRHWLDVVRYADTAGETADYPVPVAWRYRNWVIDAFNADKPYDAFLREQIAGDILARTAPPERYAADITATGFLAISRRFGFDSENYHHLTIQDTLDTLGQAVLGLSLGCARCHDHKFDPVSAKDYYALYGIFESTRYAFPGSEQKQRMRALVPLEPPAVSQVKWREFDARVALLAATVNPQAPAPPAILRSLDDPDGDFETQAPAAGGSNGVLVAPWRWRGKVSVASSAQSPFQNLYPLGRNGVRISGGANDYQITQGLHLPPADGQPQTIFVSLDFRVLKPEPGSTGAHRFRIGSRTAPVAEVLISSDSIALSSGERTDVVRTLKPEEWVSLQLVLDLEKRVVSGTVGTASDRTAIAARPVFPNSPGTIDFIHLEPAQPASGGLPPLEIDNFTAQLTPIPPLSTAPPHTATARSPAAVREELRKLVGSDGGLEFQSDGAVLATPWEPGPNALARVSSAAQSPFRNIAPAGQLGVRLPGTAAYDGIILPLGRAWREADGTLFVTFDFRIGNPDAGGTGAWRFYLGHGRGDSTAVELDLTSRELLRRSGEERTAAAPLRGGEWAQVQLRLDLKARRYAGTLFSADTRTEFSGEFANGWDGVVDTLFVDAYGPRPGVRPALDVDNFALSEEPFPVADALAAPADDAPQIAAKARVKELRAELAELDRGAEQAKQELTVLLVNGPCETTYGAVEGTPHNARLQIRGEPDRPGAEVPRGFLSALGGGTLPPAATGSGRLELAHWLTRPENPLTARVMVNRIWQYHFGRGLVETPNDFGVRGQLPTNPELLDHLATEFVRSGWSMKAMHRRIMLSAAYRQGPASIEAHSAGAGFARRRLSAEELRDAILATSGELEETPGKEHPFPPPTSWAYSQHGPFSAVYEHNKRSVYLMVQRIKRHPFLALFDGADPNTTTPDRRTTTVPTQALFFLNDPFVFAKSDKCAARLRAARSQDPDRVELAWELIAGRAPTDEEREEALEFLRDYRTELSAAEEPGPRRPARSPPTCACSTAATNFFTSIDRPPCKTIARLTGPAAASSARWSAARCCCRGCFRSSSPSRAALLCRAIRSRRKPGIFRRKRSG